MNLLWFYSTILQIVTRLYAHCTLTWNYIHHEHPSASASDKHISKWSHLLGFTWMYPMSSIPLDVCPRHYHIWCVRSDFKLWISHWVLTAKRQIDSSCTWPWQVGEESATYRWDPRRAQVKTFLALFGMQEKPVFFSATDSCVASANSGLVPEKAYDGPRGRAVTGRPELGE